VLVLLRMWYGIPVFKTPCPPWATAAKFWTGRKHRRSSQAATQAVNRKRLTPWGFLLQADQILVKPMGVTPLVDVIKHRIAVGPIRNREIESVAAILERTTKATISMALSN
jgi:hypothetical protein